MNTPDWLHEKSLPTEETFDEFVKQFGGHKISDSLSKSPSFNNADYLFHNENVIAELKNLQTDFGQNVKFKEQHCELVKKYLSENLISIDSLLGHDELPKEFKKEFIRLFRPPISRILKKANKQIKQTKQELKLSSADGILLLVNDDFVSLEPEFILGIMGEILSHSYQSIDAFVYLTLDHYVEIPNNDYANLLWIPLYSGRESNHLSDFINRLGNDWGKFLETKIGLFDNKVITDDPKAFLQAKAIPQRPLK